MEIVEKLLYNEDKLNEKCKKQWKVACIKYIGCAIIIDVFCINKYDGLKMLREKRIFYLLIQQEIWVTRREGNEKCKRNYGCC